MTRKQIIILLVLFFILYWLENGKSNNSKRFHTQTIDSSLNQEINSDMTTAEIEYCGQVCKERRYEFPFTIRCVRYEEECHVE